MKKKRTDSSFGIHFDFHAERGDSVAHIFKPDLTAKLLDIVKPDFVQCDTKGHPGLSSYPTIVGTRADSIKEDILKTWRILTNERDIALYGHHSGLYDIAAAQEHPEWAIVDENNIVSHEYISPFSDYCDKRLIPQLKELALNYKLDGAWVDGECWAAYVDYSENAQKKYKEKHGKSAPHRGDDGYEEYRNFCRQGFLDYVRHYTEEIHKIAPDFLITSNWIFSAYMPTAKNVSVDFLSGDYSSSNSVSSARYNGRCLETRKMTWDLLSWGQNAVPCSWQTHNRTLKEPTQYCQEAAEIIALGGGYVFFNIMYGGGGTVQEWAIPTWEKVSKFVREREAYCFKSEEVPEIAVIYPQETTNHDTDSLYSTDYNGYKSLCTWISALQNTQFSSSVLFECDIENRIYDYNLVVLPNANNLSVNSVHFLKNYIKNGGKLIADIASVKYFSEITGLKNTATEKKLIFTDGGGTLAAAETNCLTHSDNMKPSGIYYDDNIYESQSHTGCFIKNYGKGCIMSFCFDFSDTYENNRTASLEDFLKSRISDIGFEPIVRIKNNSFVDVILRKKGDNLLVNLINFSGNHALQNVRTYREIPPLVDIDLEIICDSTPNSVFLEPEHRKLCGKYSNGILSLNIDRVDIHSTIIINGGLKK